MRAIAAGLSDIGRERSHNEDRFILLPEFRVYVVADGMGGHQSGEVASRMAASTIASYFRALKAEGRLSGPDMISREALTETLKNAVADANAKIFARADDSRAHRGMGTTVVSATFRPEDGTMAIVHAGDSRAYHIRAGRMTQLTRDHSLLSDALLERPELTEADLSYLPKNVITRALGIGPTVDLDASFVEAEPGDHFLLCSDGLHGLIDDELIAEIVLGCESLTGCCQRLVEAANKAGGKDNITAVVIRIDEEPEPWSVRSPGSFPPGRPSQTGLQAVTQAAATPQSAAAAAPSKPPSE